VVWNLVANAVKFTPRGGRVQTLLARVNSHVEIVVSDTGRGIPPGFLPHLFERFRQADSGPTRDQGGLGLGLAIVRELVESHGGTVEASSDGEGAGATFRVRLPVMIIHREPHPEKRVHAQSEQPPQRHALLRRLDGLSVLAIDDEVDARSLLKEILESAGARTVVAASAADGLKLLEQSPWPDVIVADIGMPGMDGFEFIRGVRRLAGPASRIPAAALTAYARSEDRITSIASGFQMHIAKPVDPTELIVAISSLAKPRS
jgi:CheY-like chemotaxis protein